MENQGKSKNQMKSSYIGAFIGFVGMIIILIYALLS
jgi:preprotein translocase subunit Sss1